MFARLLRGRMRLRILVLLPLSILLDGGVAREGAAQPTRVTGVVVDGEGAPVEFATVNLPALKRGAMADGEGRFAIELPSDAGPGPFVLEILQVGYEKTRVTWSAGAGLVRIVLHEEPVPLEEVTVSTSSFGKTGKSEGAVLARMDVYTTPGGAADIFQSLRALPGINAPNEGAAVFVRGGDPKETLIRMDGAVLGHPYHYEGASGGLFAGFDTYLLKSAFFSSGGFSSKYGGVLSGVLDIETEDALMTRSVSVGANMVGGGVSTSWAIVPEKLSLLGTVSAATPELLFRLYGSASDFESAPRSQNGALKLTYKYSPTGRLSGSWIGAGDDVSVIANELNFADAYRADTRNDFASLRLEDLFGGKLALKALAFGQLYRTSWSYGEFSGSRNEDNLGGQVDAVWAATPRHELSFGGQWRGDQADLESLAPADSTDLYPGAPTRVYGTNARLDYPGFYLEDKLRVAGPVYATLGGRVDYLSGSDTWTVDPRAAIAWRVDDRQTVRVAAGRYHQPPDPSLLDPVYGNPSLGPLAATHLIAGYEWYERDLNLRVEAYRKSYDDLVLNDAETWYSNGGHGYAQGVDVFLRGSHRMLTGWMSYGYLDSKRMEYDDPREVPASYGVRHTLTLVGQYQFATTWSTGARWSLSSGRPWTPVVDRTYDAARDLWKPVYAENNSGTMPAFHRLDLRVSHLFNIPAMLGLPESGVCVAYAECMNVFGVRNTLEYYYSPDYSTRYAQDSYFSRRMVVAGVALSW
ncbi:MAG: TonB-dependent receptor [Candidatus Eiseniibacteriota bacterium]